MHQDAESKTSAFLEMMKKEKSALISENEELKTYRENMRHVVEEKERELERFGEKLAAVNTELEAKLKIITAKERDVKRLQQELSVKEAMVEQGTKSAHEMEVKNQKLAEELHCVKRNYDNAQETIRSVSEELKSARFTIASVEAELVKKANLVEVKRERIKVLEQEKKELARELNCLKSNDATAQETNKLVNEDLREAKFAVQSMEAALEKKANLLEVERERVEVLEQEKKELARELNCLKSNDATAQETNKLVNEDLQEAKSAVQSMEAALKKKANLLEMERDRAEVLEQEKKELRNELNVLKQRKKSEEDCMSREMNERETLAKNLEKDVNERKKQLREQLERVEHLMAENSQVKEDLDEVKRDFKEKEKSYSAVSSALEKSRALVEILHRELRQKKQRTEEEEPGQVLDHETTTENEQADREVKV